MSVKVRNDINLHAARIAQAAESVPEQAAELTVERARSTVPVDTGALKETIRKEGEDAKVGGDQVAYANLVDKGSINNAPTHFWGSAVEAGKQRAKELYSLALRQRGRL